MGLVRFELTIDGSLRKRHEQHMFSAPTAPHRLPRQACSADPLLIITQSHKGLFPLEPVAMPD